MVRVQLARPKGFNCSITLRDTRRRRRANLRYSSESCQIVGAAPVSAFGEACRRTWNGRRDVICTEGSGALDEFARTRGAAEFQRIRGLDCDSLELPPWEFCRWLPRVRLSRVRFATTPRLHRLSHSIPNASSDSEKIRAMLEAGWSCSRRISRSMPSAMM